MQLYATEGDTFQLKYKVLFLLCAFLTNLYNKVPLRKALVAVVKSRPCDKEMTFKYIFFKHIKFIKKHNITLILF